MKWFRSPAKINRFLFIEKRLANGYHQIFTLFEKIELFDHVGIEICEDGRSHIIIDCPEWLPKGDENLAFRAAREFIRETGSDFSIHIELKKNIPAGGGLGGGSSNCATTLKALNELTGYPINEDRLMEIASSMGADCPFFILEWTSAIGLGTGTILEKVETEPFWYVLVFPNFSVSTKWAYSNFELTRKDDETIFELRKRYMKNLDRTWQNDLEGPVCSKYPVIHKLKERLVELGAVAAIMSGSGSTVFGAFEKEDSASRAGVAISNETGYGYLVTKTLGAETINHES